MPTKFRLVKAMVFPVVMYGCESWTIKKAEHRICFWTVVLEKTLESPLDCKEIQPVHPKGDQSWVFIGRTDAKAETPILWPPHAKSWVIGKDPDAGRDWGQEEKGTTEDEMSGWYHRLDGHGFGWTPGAGDGQGGLACCGSWGHKELDMTEQLNWTDRRISFLFSRIELIVNDQQFTERREEEKPLLQKHQGRVSKSGRARCPWGSHSGYLSSSAHSALGAAGLGGGKETSTF